MRDRTRAVEVYQDQRFDLEKISNPVERKPADEVSDDKDAGRPSQKDSPANKKIHIVVRRAPDGVTTEVVLGDGNCLFESFAPAVTHARSKLAEGDQLRKKTITGRRVRRKRMQMVRRLNRFKNTS